MTRAYRDTIEAVRARVLALEKGVVERSLGVTRAFWAVLPEEVLARFEALLRVARTRRETIEGLLAAQHALEAWRELFDEALARAPEVESALNALPATAPIPASVVPSGLGGFAREAADELTSKLGRLLARHDPEASVARHGATGALGRFVVRGVPFALLAEGLGGAAAGHFTEVRLAVATSVRRGTPTVRLRPEGWGDALARTLRIRRDQHLEDPEFDAFFLVDAEPEAARWALSLAVRVALLEIARVDVPTLVVADGAATLRWRYEPTPAAVDAAVRALTGIRDAPWTASLLRREAGARRS